MRQPAHIRTRLPRLLAYLARHLATGRVPWPRPAWVYRLPGSFPPED